MLMTGDFSYIMICAHVLQLISKIFPGKETLPMAVHVPLDLFFLFLIKCTRKWDI